MSSHDSGTPNPDRPPPDPTGTSGDSTPQNPTPINELPRWATKQSATTPFSEARMAAYIGPRWETKYRDKLSPFFADPSFTVSWNWSAAIGYPLWFLYRKLYMTFAMFIALFFLVLTILISDMDKTALMNPESPEARQFSVLSMAVLLSFTIAAGGTANWFLFRRARAASYVVLMQQVPEDVALSRLQRLGGVSMRAVLIFFAFALIMGMVFSKPGVP